MNYRLETVAQGGSPTRVVLRQAHTLRTLLPLLLRLLGAAQLLWGLLMLTGSQLTPLHSTAWFLLGGGLLSMGFAQLFSNQRRMPTRFIFDNQQCLLQIEGPQTGSSKDIARLPYADIQGFQTRRISLKKQSGHQTIYVVEMHKTDGAFWTFFASPKREPAEALCSQLQRQVKLYNKPSQPPPSSAHSAGQILVEEANDGQQTKLSWSLSGGLHRSLTGLFLSCGVGLCARPFRASMPPMMWYIFLGTLGLASTLFILLPLLFLRKRHRLLISPTQLSYRPIRPDVTPFDIELKKIDTILFNFSLEDGEPTLYVLQAGETAALLQHKRGQGGLASPHALHQWLCNLHRIDARDLTFSEQLHLEYALQDLIYKHSGHRVA